jgi:hypothetical protein
MFNSFITAFHIDAYIQLIDAFVTAHEATSESGIKAAPMLNSSIATGCHERSPAMQREYSTTASII